MRNQDLGMNIDQVLIIKGPKVLRVEKNETDAFYAKSANAFKTEMLKKSSYSARDCFQHYSRCSSQWGDDVQA